MTDSVRQFVVGRDPAVTRQILGLTAVLTATAFGTLAVPAVWTEYVSPSGAGTMQVATAGAFLLAVIAAVYLVSTAGGINPYVPTAAVFVVLASYAATGIITGSQLVFFVGPSIFLGVLAALSAYANDGAVASLSVVFFPVFGYMINAPYGIAVGLSTVNRVRFALVFSLLFTFSIGIAGFLVGALIRRVVDYAGVVTVEQLIHPEEFETDPRSEITVDAEVHDTDPSDSEPTDSDAHDADTPSESSDRSTNVESDDD